MASTINQGSIIDHVDKPAIHPDDAVYQSLTPTSNGKVAVTVNGSSVTDRVHARGLIAAAGHQSNYLGLLDGLKSGQKVLINNTSSSVSLLVKDSSDNLLLTIDPSDTNLLVWQFTSSSAGSWYGPGSSLSLLDGASSSGAKSMVIDKSSRFQIFDDFHAAAIDTTDNWIVFAGGDGDATAAATATAPEGTVLIGSGGTGGADDGSVMSLILLAKGALVSLGGTVFETRVSFDQITGTSWCFGLSDTLAEGTERNLYKVNSGTISDGGLSLTNAVCWAFDTDATAPTKFQFCSENAGTIAGSAAEAAHSAGPSADTYVTLRIEVDSDGDARFYLDGTLVKTVTTAVATTSLLIPFIGGNSADDADIPTDVTVDYVLFEGGRPSSNA